MNTENKDETTGGLWIEFASRLVAFLRESLAIEGINREPTSAEIVATEKFLHGDLTVDAVLDLQRVYAPGQPLRDRAGMNVRIGKHIPLLGNPRMREELEHVLNNADPWSLHVAFQVLHPFMDGNGRTGRAVWAAVMIENGEDPFALSFLHRFYYQTLDHADGR